MKTIRFTLLLLIVMAASPAMAKGIRIKVVDANGNPFPNVLAIVQGLTDYREMGRFLSDKDGLTPEIQVSDEIFRVIATCPYGLCRTSVHEFLLASSPKVVAITAQVVSSDENGVPVGYPKSKLLLERPHEKTQGAKILVRDPLARWEHWYVADKDGSAEIELPYDPTVIVVFLDHGTYVHYVSPCPSTQRPPLAVNAETRAAVCKPIILNLRDE